MVVGVRQVNDSDLPSQGWVNTHLQYTHGYAMILAPVQPVHQRPAGLLHLPGAARVHARRPADQPAPGLLRAQQPQRGDVDYVLANTNQPEIDYPGRVHLREPRPEHYQGDRGRAAQELPRQGGLRHPVRRLQPARLEPGHLALAADVRPRHHPDGTEGGTLPELRLRPLPRAAPGARSTGSSTPTPRPTTTRTPRTSTRRRCRRTAG